MKYLVAVIFIALNFYGVTQPKILKGKVVDIIDQKPIQFANVYYVDDSIGLGTTTDTLGQFILKLTYVPSYLVTQFVGYINDTVFLNDDPQKLLKTTIPLTPIYLKRNKPEYFYIMNQDTIFFHHYDDENGYYIPSPGTWVRNCNGIPCYGQITTYFLDGRIKEIATYKEGIHFDGEYKSYYSNGVLETKGNYFDYKRVGQWLFFSKNDMLDAILNYDSIGRLVSEYWFYDKGNLRDHSVIINEKACVVASESYFETGELESWYFHPDCNQDSAYWYEFFKNGEIRIKKTCYRTTYGWRCEE